MKTSIFVILILALTLTLTKQIEASEKGQKTKRKAKPIEKLKFKIIKLAHKTCGSPYGNKINVVDPENGWEKRN